MKLQTSLAPLNLSRHYFHKQGLENSPLEGHKVKVFAALLHTHLAGTDENNGILAGAKHDPKQNSLASSTIRLTDL